MSERKNAIDWDERERVMREVRKAGGTARDAGERLGLSADTVLKASRRLGIRFPPRNFAKEARGMDRKAKPRTDKPKGAPNAGTVAVAAQNKTAWNAYHQRRRFASALERAPEQPLSDAELIEKAIAEGRVTRVAPGSALIPLWLSGAVDNCVKPKAGASRGARA